MIASATAPPARWAEESSTSSKPSERPGRGHRTRRPRADRRAGRRMDASTAKLPGPWARGRRGETAAEGHDHRPATSARRGSSPRSSRHAPVAARTAGKKARASSPSCRGRGARKAANVSRLPAVEGGGVAERNINELNGTCPRGAADQVEHDRGQRPPGRAQDVERGEEASPHGRPAVPVRASGRKDRSKRPRAWAFNSTKEHRARRPGRP